MKSSSKYLLAILAAAAILRVINLGSGDLVGNDEVLYAFRSVGITDFVNSPAQTTPPVWFDGHVPGWAGLSMHDHPLLVFIVQHIFMGIFGENNFGFRFPSAVFGVLSVYLVYLISKKLFSERAGLISAALMALTVNNVYISRLGLQESYLIFFILLTSWLFLNALERPKYFLWTGAAFGFTLLTKYNGAVVAPVILTYLLLFRRDVFRQKYFWLGGLLAACIASPILIYNIGMYRATGHFDFQISYLLGQHPAIWQSAPGKEVVGSFGDRLRAFIPNLIASNSPLLMLLFALTIPFFIREIARNRAALRRKAFLDISFVWIILLLLFIGPTFRFLTLLTPFIVMKVGLFLDDAFPKRRHLLAAFLAAFLIFECLYSLNSVVTNYPAGPEGWAFSHLRYENFHWGYNELEDYFSKELAGKYPLLTFDLQYQFLEKQKEAGVAAAKAAGATPYPALLVYDENIHSGPQLWTFDRRQIYHGWPVMTAGDYLKLISEKGPRALENSGIQVIYFAFPTDAVALKATGQLTSHGKTLEPLVASQKDAFFIPVKNGLGQDAFHIYRLSFIRLVDN